MSEQEQNAGAQDNASLRDALRGPNDPAAPTPADPPPDPGGDKKSGEIVLGGPSFLDRALFCRQLATLIEVGIPLLKSLQMLGQRTSHPKMRTAILDTARLVEEGQSIHQAMSAHAQVFSPIVVSIVRVGEIGGILEASLVRLAEIMETKTRIMRQIKTATFYPITALTVALIVIVLIMVKAVPVFYKVYQQNKMEDELPAVTKMLKHISDVMTHWWPVVVIAIPLIYIGLKMLSKTPGGKAFNSRFALYAPLIKGINKKIGVARFTRTLGSLVAAGIPLTDALAIAADTQENLVIADTLRDVHKSVESGERIGPPLADAGIFPPLVVDMISIGEESGTLDKMLVRIADIYDAEVDSTFAGISSIIEPVLIVLLGGAVFFIALAVLLPYFKLVTVISAGED